MKKITKLINKGFCFTVFSYIISSCTQNGPTTSSRLYIGDVPENKVYICNLDGTNCKAIEHGLKLNSSDYFGTGISAGGNELFIGSSGANSDTGAVYKCNLNGNNCNIINHGLKLNTKDMFGQSVFIKDTNLFISALLSSDHNKGKVYKCNLDGKNCSEIKHGLKLQENDGFGTAIFGINNSLFISSYGKNGTGEIFKCDLEGTKCTPIKHGLNLKPNDGFGFCLSGTNTNLYVCAIGSKQVYQCNINGENCSAIKHDLPNNVYPGVYIAATNSNLFLTIKTSVDPSDNDLKVYKCSLNGSNCEEIKHGLSPGKRSLGFPIFTLYH